MQSEPFPPSPMPLEILLLRLAHVLGGIFWAGGGIYGALFVTPALIAAGPAAAPIIADMQRRKLFTVLPVVAILTMLSGLRLLWIVSGGFGAAYFGTRQGLTYALAGGASIVAFLVALSVARPAGVRLGQLAATLEQLAPDARAATLATMATLKRRSALGSAVAIWLLAFAALGMSVARYL